LSICQDFFDILNPLHKSITRNISGAAGVIAFFTLMSRILGLVRDMVLATLFGSGMAADAFFVALRIPNLLRRLFAEGSLTIAFIPVFTEYLTLKGREDAFELARIVFTVLSLILAVVTVLGILFAPAIVTIQAFGFGSSGAKYDLTVFLTRLTFPYIFFIGMVAFFMGVLNSLRHFAAPAAAPILLNVGIIGAALLISPHCVEPIAGVAMGVVLGGVLQVALQIPWVYRAGLKLFPTWKPFHPAVKRIGRLMLPAVFGSAVYQLNQFVGTLLASFLKEGSISWLYYADRLVQFPLGIFAIAIATAALPSLSGDAARRDHDRFLETLEQNLCLIFFIVLPAMAGLIILGKPIVVLFFERGAFGAESSAMTTQALVCYTFGLWAFSGIRLLIAAFYALQDTKTPVKVAVISLGVNIIASLLFMGPLKHAGLALALSVASGIQFGLLALFLRKKGLYIRFRPILKSVFKSGFAALVMGAIVLLCRAHWFYATAADALSKKIFSLSTLVLIGVVVYFFVAHLLGCKEIRAVSAMLGFRGSK
jgi:putative peptidoglycan lipid II flippase